ncbi:PEP-CTERM sorting domain-containing protein [Lacipirellula sp.]|uniref:PEP-CTERM sorting domain-containing protein n=1 Tax=Lacipirellula sp. TaxID=2691419 RepID=UPI003D0BD7F4
MKHRIKLVAAAVAASGVAAIASPALAVSYASNVTKTGTTVNFILNSPADILSYSINGGAPVTLDGTTKGAKTFNLTSASDTFSIIADRTDATGYSVKTGNTIAGGTSALFAASDEGGLRTISDDTSVLNRFNSPRGISVSNNPNAPNFGTTYVANSNTGALVASGTYPARTLAGEGLYALRSDGSDAYGFADAGQNPMIDGFPAWSTNPGPTAPTGLNSPFRPYVASDGSVYVSDYSDLNGSVIQIAPNLSTGINVLPGFTGVTPLPSGQNHGSTTSVHVEGSLAGGNLKVFTVDEDLTTNHLTGAGSTTDSNSLWQYDIGSGPFPSAVTPTKIASVLTPGAATDMQRGADGKWYLSQYRAGALNSPTLFVLSPDGSTVLFNSLLATRTLTANPTADRDILQYAQGMAVSPDQNWLALVLNNSDIAVLPLVDGVPDLANRRVVGTAPDIVSGRDIAFDAAGNIHYVSSGQGLYRVIAPGGHSLATTTWNGTSYAFNVQTITPPVGLPGDFNGDSKVDGADFLLWQRGGSPTPLSTADLDTWKANFGTSAATPAASAVPEPASIVGGLTAAAFGMLALRRRQVKK